MRFINVPRQMRFLGIRTSRVEIIDLLKGWFAISVAFTLLYNKFSFGLMTLLIMLVSAITVGTGFLLHELAHKFVAQHYKCWAEFRADNTMLVIAVFSAMFGFIFAAPGAVMIHGPHITRKQNGIISAAGPMTNFILAALFLGLLFVPFSFGRLIESSVNAVANAGFLINTWLGLFNMIPIMNFDGKKIFAWNKVVWGVMGAVGVGLFVLNRVLFAVS
jgi:Zn-dependent protease